MVSLFCNCVKHKLEMVFTSLKIESFTNILYIVLDFNTWLPMSVGKFSVLWGGNFLLLRVEVFVGIIQFRPLKLNPPTLAIPSHCFCKWRLNIPVNKENEKIKK